jgi:ABC-type dipeptide/oligopeptide/nickel transport system permease subunit
VSAVADAAALAPADVAPRRTTRRPVIGRLVRQPASAAGLAFLGLLLLTAILGSLAAPFDPYASVLSERLVPPSARHLLGTDALGRDILSRMLYGARLSLLTGAVVVVVSSLGGALLGILAGYAGGWLDNLIMRVVDALLCFPGILLAIGITAALGPGVFNMMIAIAISNIPAFARVTRVSTLSIRELPFAEAARGLGAGHLRIIVRHITPNLMGSVIVLATLRFGVVILTAASLSFLGLGPPPPTAEWGAMLNEGRAYLRTMPHAALIPGLAITLTILAFNLVGDAVRDALDPRLRHVG